MKVRFSHSVRIYLSELIQVLYEKEYFGFEKDATEYVLVRIFQLFRRHLLHSLHR